MALLYKRNITDDCVLGIWEIAESCEELYSRLTLTPEEEGVYNSFGNDVRRLEWLSVRVLLREIAEKELTIVYNGNRKPLIKGNSYHISISHSNKLSSVLLSRGSKVGIDLEYITPRIESIAHKFINEEEMITENLDLRMNHLYIHWCAKEALYKICDKSGINFKTSLTIEPFIPSQTGIIKGVVYTRRRKEQFSLRYFTLNDSYILVYTIK